MFYIVSLTKIISQYILNSTISFYTWKMLAGHIQRPALLLSEKKYDSNTLNINKFAFLIFLVGLKRAAWKWYITPATIQENN